MVRILLYTLLSLSVLFCSCTSSKEYHHNVKNIFDDICKMASTCEMASQYNLQVWDDAIFKKQDPYGNYCEDFNDALQILFDRCQYEYYKLEKDRDSLTYKLATIKDAPSECKSEYDDLIDLTTALSAYIRFTTKISGSLEEYRDGRKFHSNEIQKQIDSFKIKHSDALFDELSK